MSFKTSLAVVATAIGLTAISYPAEAATVRVALTYTYDSGDSSSSAGSGYFEINDSLLQPGTYTGNLDDLLGFSLTFTGLAGTPSTTTFTKDDLILWGFDINNMSGILTVDFYTSPNMDGYDLQGTILSGNGQNTTYMITTGTPQSIPEPGSVVALLGLGLGALASRGKKQA